MLDKQTQSAVFGRDPKDTRPNIVRSEGIRMWDDAGNEYIDGSSGAISVVSVGHGRQEVLDAMAAQAGKVAYVQGGMLAHDAAEALASKLVEYTPGDLNSVMFVSGGSEANESAIKLARQYHLLRGNGDKHIVLSRRRSYHGNTIGALTLSGYEARRRPYPAIFQEYKRSLR